MTEGEASQEIERLRKRLDRERRARADAEQLAERGTRELYERQRELAMLHVIADAANAATSPEAAMQVALDEVCRFTEWPVGHAYLAAPDASGALVPSSLWHLDDAERFREFRRVTEAMNFDRGVGLPGRVLADRRSVWLVDATKDGNFPRRDAAVASGLSGAFAFPVLVGDEVVAVLEFFSREPSEPDESWLKIARQIGTQLGRIFERRRADAALVESRARFREVVENIDEAFWMTDLATSRTLYVSPRFELIFGRPCTVMYDAPGAWLESVQGDDRERVAQAVQARQSAAGHDDTFRIVRPDGGTRWIRNRGFPVKDEAGNVTRMVEVADDITAAKKLEEQLLRTQRLEAIGTLASGIAHDLNNILTPMLMAAGLLRGAVADERDQALVAMIERGSKRGADIIKQLLTFSRGIEGVRGAVQPRHLLNEIVGIARETFPKDIEVASAARADLWPVIADATQMHQVLLNLSVNARDAMPQGGKLTLGARNLELGENEVHVHPGAKPGPYVVITVTDTGQGIPPEIAARIFDPFFTTKEVGKGTGLGLSTVLGIVKSHGGFVTVYSEPDKGAAFKVYLPAQPSARERAVAVAADELPRGNGELVLVVDDEDPIRETTRQALERHGYQVVTAVNGEDALTVFVEQSGAIRAVVTDMMMPVMSGTALVRALRMVAPTLGIVATSGLHQGGKRAELTALGVSEILMKPTSPKDLLEAVRRVLTTSGGR